MGRQDFETETLLAVGGFPSSHTREVGVYTCDDCGLEFPAMGDIDSANQRVQVDGFMLLANPCPHCGGGASYVSYPEGSFGATAQGCGQVVTAFRTAGDGCVYEEGDRTAPLTTATDPNTNIVAIQNATRGKEQNGLGISDDGSMYTLDQGSQHAVCFDTTQITSKANYSNPKPGDPCHPLASEGHPPAVALRASGQEGFTPSEIAPPIGATDGGGAGAPTTQYGMEVRRLVPEECEALQGFPRGFTKLTDKTPDGPRYKALGNSMAVPCMRWLGERIQMVEDICNSKVEVA